MSYYSSKNAKPFMKKKFKEKESFTQMILKQKIKYPQLSQSETLYPQTLHLLKNNEFNSIIRRVTRQLAPLLSLPTYQFFKLFQTNTSIRTTLESCLAILTRRAYSRLSDARNNPKNAEYNLESFKTFTQLNRTVLFIFYRISQAKQQQDRTIVYNEWLLDIPKLLDIAAIYGQSNPKIVKKIIQNTYLIASDYDRDTLDFFNIVQKGKFGDLELDQQIDVDFSPSSLQQQNFGNRQRFLIQKVMRTLFYIKDIIVNLENFYTYFPKKYVYQIVTDYKIQQRLIAGVCSLFDQMNNKWIMDRHRQRYFELHFEDIRQSVIRFFIHQFTLLKEILNSKEVDAKQFEQQAHNTYQTFCTLLYVNKRPLHKEYCKLINNLIEQSDEFIFFLNATKIFNCIQKTKKAVEYSQSYEKKYRYEIKINRKDPVFYDQIFKKNHQNLQKFKQFYVSKQQLYKKMVAQQKQKKMRPIPDIKLISTEYKLFEGCKLTQYDDEPEEGEILKFELPNEYDEVRRLKQQTTNLSFYYGPQMRRNKDSLKGYKGLKENSINISFSTNRDKMINDKSSISFVYSKQSSKSTQQELNLQFQLAKKSQILRIENQQSEQSILQLVQNLSMLNQQEINDFNSQVFSEGQMDVVDGLWGNLNIPQIRPIQSSFREEQRQKRWKSQNSEPNLSF